MGLLDNILSGMQSPGGRLGLGLLAAAGPTAQPRSFGQRAMGLLAQMDADKAAEEERKQRAQMQALQEQLLKAQLGERQEAAGDRQRQRDQMLRDEQVVQQFVTPMAGPTPDGNPLMPRFDPMAVRQQGGSQRAVQELLALQPQRRERKLMEVGGVLVEVPDEGPVTPLFTPPAKPDKPTSAMQEYEFAKGQGFQGSFLDFQLQQKRAGAAQTTVSYGSPVAGTDAQGNPVFFQPSRTGGAPAIIPGVVPPKKDNALTEAQAKAATFLSQMRQAEGELARLPKAFDPTKLTTQVETQLASGPTNILTSQAAQRARQAQEQWAESALRFKTGAAATADEVRMNVRTFFPQPGDTPEVIEQKKRARQSLERDLEFAAGARSDVNANRPQNAGAPDPLGLRGGR